MNKSDKEQTESRIIYDDEYIRFLNKAREIKNSKEIVESEKNKMLEELNTLFQEFIDKYYSVLSGEIDLRRDF